MKIATCVVDTHVTLLETNAAVRIATYFGEVACNAADFSLKALKKEDKPFLRSHLLKLYRELIFCYGLLWRIQQYFL